MNPDPVRVVFGIMSATENPAVVAQLVEAIGPDHPVLVHHDFSKRANFDVSGPNVQVIANPQCTGWGTWGFVQGVLQLMRTALERTNGDYFQLLSGTCLPVRPISELIRSIASQSAPVNADLMNLDEDADAMMTMGFRVFSPQGTLRFRVLQRMRHLYFGPDAQADLVHRASLALLERPSHRRGAFYGSAQSIAGLVTRAARRGIGFNHPFTPEGMSPFVGSTWFGCRRTIAERIVTRSSDAPFEKFARKLLACDEIYFPTLLGNLGVPIAPSNHFVSAFQGPHPRPITRADLPDIRDSARFFARKFSNDPQDAARLAILRGDMVPQPLADVSVR